MLKKISLTLILIISLNELVKCGEVNLLNSINIKWQNQGNRTQFWLTANLPTSVVNDTSNAWIGVGINDDDEMV